MAGTKCVSRSVFTLARAAVGDEPRQAFGGLHDQAVVGHGCVHGGEAERRRRRGHTDTTLCSRRLQAVAHFGEGHDKIGALRRYRGSS